MKLLLVTIVVFYILYLYMGKHQISKIKNDIFDINVESVQVQGKREYQEDQFFIHHIPKHIVLTGIFDGHGGDKCSKWLNENFKKDMIIGMEKLHKTTHKCLINTMLADQSKITPGNISNLLKMLKKEYVSVELNKIILSSEDEYIKLKKINDFLYEYLMKKTLFDSSKQWDKLSIPRIDTGESSYRAGCTALIVLMVGHTIHIMWVGDSRAIFIRDHEPTINSTKDHKPHQDDIVGGSNAFVSNNRVNGILGVGRAIGDNGRRLRGALKRTPDYISYWFDDKTTIILGSDGLYDENNHPDILNMDLKKIKSEEYADNTTVVKINIVKKSQ